MKKWIIIILVGISAYWGYQQGTDDVSALKQEGNSRQQTPREQQMQKVPSLSPSSAAEAFRALLNKGEAFFNSSSTEKAQAPAAPHQTQGSSNQDESLKGRFMDIYDFPEHLEQRIHRDRFVPISKISPFMCKSIVAVEDHRFYEHGAIDLVGIGRAMYINYAAGHTVEGGSTIAQQTVKNVFLSNERTASRKADEMLLAIQLERHYTKDQILEIYLNTIYFGHGAWGIGEASRTYFGVEPSALTPAQCAMLAGLPQAPDAYDPLNHPEEASARRNTVLAILTARDVLSPADALAAGTADLGLKKK